MMNPMIPTQLHKQTCSVCAAELGYTLHESPHLSFCSQCIFIVQRYFRESDAVLNNPFLRIFTTGRYGVEKDETIWTETPGYPSSWSRTNINQKPLT